MAKQSNFNDNFGASATKPRAHCRFGTIGLSDMSDIVTVTNGRRRLAGSFKDVAMAIALLICASPVAAETMVETSNCKYSFYYGYQTCRTTSTRIPAPDRNPEQERLNAMALQKEDAKWEAFCKPRFTVDAFGVRRAAYAARGCEFGRSE